MKQKTIRPGETLLMNDDESPVAGSPAVALAEFSPSERKKGIALWRRAIEEVAAGKLQPPRAVLASVYEQAGGLGDATAAFVNDLRDWKAVKSGEQTADDGAFEKFIREHGTRGDLVKQWDACHETLRTLKKLLAKHDSLQRTYSLRVHQAESIKKANKRLFG